jgi:membrane associated rhomboid family serine protease
MDEALRCYRHPNRETRVTCSECERPICEDCMHFAPVGIRCPDHANIGAVKPSATRTVRRAKGRVAGLDAPATVALVAANVLVYLITVGQGAGLNRPGGELYDKGALFISLPFLPDQGLAQGEWWRLITAAFLHGSIIHLAFNMFALFWLGSIVEQALGATRYLLIYFASGLAGSAGALLMDPNAITVGASGAIYGIFGALLILEYLATGTIAGPALTLIVLNLAITFTIPNISIGGHLGGLLGGVLATLALTQTRRLSRSGLIGPALVVLVGAASVAVAYFRVESYLL